MYGLKAFSNSRTLPAIPLAVAMWAMCGCFPFASSAPTHFYSLSCAGESAPAPENPSQRVALITVNVPEHLQRTIVTRVGSHELRVAELHVWGEPLDKGVSRLLVQVLQRELAGQGVLVYPGEADETTSLRLAVSLQELESDSAGNALLEAFWSVRDAAGKEVISKRKASLRTAGGAADIDGIVERLSSLVSQLGVNIAAEIAPLAGTSRELKSR